jgi:hypothetical protein
MKCNMHKSVVCVLFCMGVKLGVTLREKRWQSFSYYLELRKIFGPRRDEVTCEWTRLFSEGLSDSHSSQNIIRVTKSRRLK